jgi:hypothetical protein
VCGVCMVYDVCVCDVVCGVCGVVCVCVCVPVCLLRT